jgi:predicted dehydrogenase
MAGGHARAYNEIPEADLVSCYDVIPEKAKAFAKTNKIKRVATDLDGLLADVDAVAVVTPDKHHASVSLAVLRAGKHLMCEKPLTTSLADAREVAGAATKSKVIHMTNFSYRQSAAFQRAITLVQSGALGELRHGSSFYLQSWLSSRVWGSWTGAGLLWRLDARQSGGVLGDIGCHILDMTTAIAGEVKRIRCDLRCFPKLLDETEVTTYEGQPLDGNDTANIELELLDGTVCVVQTTRWGTGHVNSLRCELHGTKGALRLDLDKSYTDLEVCLGDAINRAEWEVVANSPAPSNYQRFVAAIVNGEPATPDVVRGAQIQAYLDACERSAVSGAWESVLTWLPEKAQDHKRDESTLC